MKHAACNHRDFLASFAAMLCIPLLSAPLQGLSAENVTSETVKSSYHHVVTGDSLYKLAYTYLDDPAKWREFLLYNEVKNPRRLMPGSNLYIPPSTAYAMVIFAHGNISLLTEKNKAGKPVEVGDKLSEGATINTGSNSYLSIRFSDDSIVRVLSDSVLEIRKLRESVDSNIKTQKLNRILRLEQGDLDISVTPSKNVNTLRKTMQNTFEVITPQAVAAVRGTRFDVTASNASMTSGVTTGSVDIRQNIPTKISKHVAIIAGTGIVVNSDGKFGMVRPLLVAPDLSGLPEIIQDADYIQLSWPKVENAASYHARISSDTEMHKVLENLESTTPVIKLQGLVNGRYVIGLRAVDSDGVIGNEAMREFTVQASPVYPFHLQPAHKQIVGNNVVIKCTEVAGVSGYHMQISRSESFVDDVIDTNQLDACNHTIHELKTGSYYWRVASIIKNQDDSQIQGPYSRPSRFDVEDGHSNNQEKPTVVYWMDTRPLAFNVKIASDITFSNIIQEKTLQSSQIDLEGLPSGTYYLQTQVKDAQDFTGAYSDIRIVEIKAKGIEQSIERTWADKVK